MEKKVDVRKTAKTTGMIGGRVTVFVILGMIAESLIVQKAPALLSLPSGTVTGAVASALYEGWDAVKRKWL